MQIKQFFTLPTHATTTLPLGLWTGPVRAADLTVEFARNASKCARDYCDTKPGQGQQSDGQDGDIYEEIFGGKH